MDGSEAERNWGRGFNRNARPYIPSSLGSVRPPRIDDHGTSSSRMVQGEKSGQEELGTLQNRERLHLWKGRVDGSSPRGGQRKKSLREWLDNPARTVELVECLHIFKQVADLVAIAHTHKVVVTKIRPSCLVLSSLNRVSFIDSASCSTSESSSGSGCGADSCQEDGGDLSIRAGFAPEMDDSQGRGGERMLMEVEVRKKAFLLKRILMMESNWYTSPEETAGGGNSSFASDVYRLGVLLFELCCTFSSPEEKLRTMSNLRHRVLPPQLLLKWPKEASFCLWLMHPLPDTRPKMSEVLKSELLLGPIDNIKECEAAANIREEIEDDELLLDFLANLQERKRESADRLHGAICCLSSDIEEVIRKQSNLKENVGTCMELDNDKHGYVMKKLSSLQEEVGTNMELDREGQSGVEKADFPLIYPDKLDAASSNFGPRKRPRTHEHLYKDGEVNTDVFSTLGSDCKPNVKEKIWSKSSRLMKNFKKLESAYFLTRCRTIKPMGKFQNRNIVSGSLGRGSVARTDTSSVDNLIHKESPVLGRKGDWINPFLEGLCKYLAFSKLNIRADLKQGDLLSSSNLVCSLAFDRDKELFATAGVNRKIKVFECDSILDEYRDIHYPVVEMSGKSKFSSICWNSYIKSQIASSDFEGAVQVWDVTRSEVIVQMKEHEKHVWSVDFSLSDPTKLASGSDDGTVKLWNINQLENIGTIKTKANICSVQFRPDSGHSLAVGSADHRVYCYDLRNLKTPWCTLMGHSKTVSYVKFVDSNTLVSASTDNTIKTWDLSPGSSAIMDDPIQTFTGHTNIKNFVGLSISDGYIATGSETNEVFVYHKAFPMPMLTFKFDNTDPISGRGAADANQFVSCICWRGQSKTLVAANSTGNIKLLEMI